MESCRSCGSNPMTNTHYEMCSPCLQEYMAAYNCRCGVNNYPCRSCIGEMLEEGQ